MSKQHENDGANDLDAEIHRTMAEAEAAVGARGGPEEAEAIDDEPHRDPVEEALTERIAELEAEVAQTKDRWLRAVADHENYKKRVKRDTDDAIVRNTQQLLSSLLPTVDNLERAMEVAAQSGAEEPVMRGLSMVRDEFLAALKRHGIEPVASVGLPFDPAVHDALQQMVSPEHAPGVVVREFEKGYRLGDRLLRPARVIVAAAGSGTERPGTEA
jgi:molecular chaperone GrpE